jgi:molybdopterin/thiamine biosynthesis adenylyltransferase
VTRAPWYDEQPERADWELEQLRAEGLTIDEELRQDGQLTVRSALEHKGEQLPITITFPCEFPDAAPSIFGDSVVLERHQDRRGCNFCMLENRYSDWDSGRSARELVQLLKRLLRDDDAGPAAVAEGEADMPEPASAYYDYAPGVVIVCEQFLCRELTRDQGHATLSQIRDTTFFLCKAEGFDDASRELTTWFGGQSTMPAYWLAADEPPDPANVDASLGELLNERAPGLLRQLRVRAKSSGRNRGAKQLVGVTFLEEGPTLGEQRRTWVLFEISLPNAKAAPRVSRIIQAQAMSLAERQRRLPELKGLGDLRALVIGAGSLGGEVAVELAKAGFGALDIVDSDIYDVNNAVRHVLEPRFAGAQKAAAVALRCREMNPFATCTPYGINIGSSLQASDSLEQLVAAADVVVETTGAQSIVRIVQRYTRACGKPLVVAGLTAGSYGGELIVIRPQGACFDCYVHAQDDGTIRQPPQGPAHRVTPIGCRHPAFSGAGFDATSLAADAARTAVRATGHVAYPPLDYDWAIISFRTQPRWEQGALYIHERCHRRHG